MFNAVLEQRRRADYLATRSWNATILLGGYFPTQADIDLGLDRSQVCLDARKEVVGLALQLVDVFEGGEELLDSRGG